MGKGRIFCFSKFLKNGLQIKIIAQIKHLKLLFILKNISKQQNFPARLSL